MWDVHIRLGGFAGSGIQVDNCAKHADHAIAPCTAAFLGLHITSQATAYLEGTWVWTADHDLDDVDQSQASGWGVFSFHQIDVYTGRGVLTESVAGPVWFIGTASEHHAISQYTIAYSQNVYGGFMQTETAYYQPNPKAPSPFCVDPTYHDPTFTNGPSGWSLYIKSSSNVYLYGAGFYSFFRDYAQTCLDDYTCQKSIIKVDSKSPNIYLYSISTIGTTWMLNVDSTPIINQNQNRNGFASTFTIWTSTVSTHRRRMRIEGQAALEAASEQSLII
ncbi:hypothetical protein FRB99_003536 [Tulasnella sp. 403]|nr:hypothetical protein FRB99_003536 [Tulasnella sp. 403]